MSDEIAAVCQRLGLAFEAALPVGRPGPGVFLARVRGPGGGPLLLKRLSPETGAHEVATLRAWSDTGIAPRFVGEPAPGFVLVESIVGAPLHEVPDPRRAAVEVGRALRRLHDAVAPPPVCPDTRVQFFPERRALFPRLPPDAAECRQRLAADLLRRHPAKDVLLHGDAVPAQVLLAGGGPRLVNPLGRRGLRAWDLAQLAVTCAGRGVRRLLPALVEGYGQRPPLLDEVAACMVFAYLDKNLAAADSPAVPRFRPMAAALVAGATPAALVAEHLS